MLTDDSPFPSTKPTPPHQRGGAGRLSANQRQSMRPSRLGSPRCSAKSPQIIRRMIAEPAFALHVGSYRHCTEVVPSPKPPACPSFHHSSSSSSPDPRPHVLFIVAHSSTMRAAVSIRFSPSRLCLLGNNNTATGSASKAAHRGFSTSESRWATWGFIGLGRMGTLPWAHARPPHRRQQRQNHS